MITKKNMIVSSNIVKKMLDVPVNDAPRKTTEYVERTDQSQCGE
jgi:hypothetical protein